MKLSGAIGALDAVDAVKSGDSYTIAAGSMRGSFRTWWLQSHDAVPEVLLHVDTAHVRLACLTRISDGQLVVTAGRDQCAKVWSLRRPEAVPWAAKPSWTAPESTYRSDYRWPTRVHNKSDPSS